MITYVLTQKKISREGGGHVHVYGIAAKIAGLPVTSLEDVSIHREIVLGMIRFFSFIQMPPYKLKSAVSYLLSVDHRLWAHVARIA